MEIALLSKVCELGDYEDEPYIEYYLSIDEIRIQVTFEEFCKLMLVFSNKEILNVT